MPILVTSARSGRDDVGEHVHFAAMVHAHLEHGVAVLLSTAKQESGRPISEFRFPSFMAVGAGARE